MEMGSSSKDLECTPSEDDKRVDAKKTFTRKILRRLRFSSPWGRLKGKC